MTPELEEVWLMTPEAARSRSAETAANDICFVREVFSQGEHSSVVSNSNPEGDAIVVESSDGTLHKHKYGVITKQRQE